MITFNCLENIHTVHAPARNSGNKMYSKTPNKQPSLLQPGSGHIRGCLDITSKASDNSYNKKQHELMNSF